MKEYSVNTLYLTEIAQLGELKQFGAWVYYKSMFKKGCVFNYTDVHFSRRVGISVSSARLLRIFWLSRGWCRMDGKNLIFNSARNSVRREKWHKTSVKVYKTIEETVKELYYKVIYNKAKQFDFLKRISTATFNASKTRRLKDKFVGKLPKVNDRFKISYKGIGSLFGCSDGKAYNLITELLKDRKVYVFKKQRRLVIRTQSNVCLKMANYVNEGSYISDKCVYKNYCNEYVFK